jgi:hypothetical protein
MLRASCIASLLTPQMANRRVLNPRLRRLRSSIRKTMRPLAIAAGVRQSQTTFVA